MVAPSGPCLMLQGLLWHQPSEFCHTHSTRSNLFSFSAVQFGSAFCGSEEGIFILCMQCVSVIGRTVSPPSPANDVCVCVMCLCGPCEEIDVNLLTRRALVPRCCVLLCVFVCIKPAMYERRVPSLTCCKTPHHIHHTTK